MSETSVQDTGAKKDKKKKSSAGSVILLILIYAVIYLVCSAMFVGLFHTGILKNMDVLMYRGLAFIILTGLIAAIVMGVIFLAQFIFVTICGEVLSVHALTATTWLVCAVLAFLVIPIDVCRKVFMNKKD